jgi:very-short-patch-repair endonuclease
MLTGPAATIGKARRLRKEMSLPEVILWNELRRRPAGFKFRRQHPAGPFILDFVCLGAQLAIEIDGSGHDFRVHRDEARDEWLANQGFVTMRIAATDVMKNLDAVMRGILARCETAAQPLHQPSAGPPPRSGEDLA